MFRARRLQKLDEYANNVFIDVLRSGINCAGIVSEENEEMVVFDDIKSNQSKYVLLMDPIDGSGNIDINISIGSIFQYLPPFVAVWGSRQPKRIFCNRVCAR